jgi:hypothetical protein
MRKTLLASATLIAMACMPAAFAQTAAPGPDSAAPDSTAPDAASGAPGAGKQAPMHHRYYHHHMAAQSDGSEPTTWAHEPGTGLSGPASERASNTDASNTHSEIAPHLPQPSVGMNAWGYLRAADSAIAGRRTGEAQQELEMAETRFLDRSTLPANADVPDQGPLVTQVSQARQALGHGDLAGAHAAIQTALSNEHAAPMPQAGGMGMQPQAGMAPGMAPGAGPMAGPTAGAAMGGSPVATGTADSAGGAR